MAKLTGRAREVLNMATQEAVRAGRQTVGVEMLLIALLSQEPSAASVALESESVDRDALRDSLRALFPAGPGHASSEPIHNRRARRALDAAFTMAKELGNPYIGTEHLLLGVATNLSPAGRRVAETAGVEFELLEDRVKALGEQRVEDGTPDRWNELLKAELAEKLKEIDLDTAAEPHATRTQAPAKPDAEQAGTRWEYRAIALGGERQTPERLAREIEETTNRQVSYGWEYVDLSIAHGHEGQSAVLIMRRRV